MARFLLFLLLLIAGWAVIFYPLSKDSAGVGWFGVARPAERLPRPWQRGAAVQVAPQAEGEQLAVDAGCPVEHTLAPGETLGALALRCGIPLESLSAANPQIANPNRIYAGQVIHIPQPAGRGGGGDGEFVFQQEGGYAPGSVLDIRVEGLPPNAVVKAGLGLSESGYKVLARGVTGSDGSLALSLTIPSSATPGDRAFVLVTGEDVPAFQVISPEFRIGE